MTQMFGFKTNTPDGRMVDGFVDIVMHGIVPNQHIEKA
jgi:hypothetical protein